MNIPTPPPLLIYAATGFATGALAGALPDAAANVAKLLIPTLMGLHVLRLTVVFRLRIRTLNAIYAAERPAPADVIARFKDGSLFKLSWDLTLWTHRQYARRLGFGWQDAPRQE